MGWCRGNPHGGNPLINYAFPIAHEQWGVMQLSGWVRVHLTLLQMRNTLYLKALHGAT